VRTPMVAVTSKTALPCRPRWLGAWAVTSRWWPSPSGAGRPSTPPHEAGFVGTPGRGPRPAPVHQAPEAGHAARDGTCRFPGCGVPARWTHLHHLIPWELGGPSQVFCGISDP
jgi:hypothetical protein